MGTLAQVKILLNMAAIKVGVGTQIFPKHQCVNEISVVRVLITSPEHHHGLWSRETSSTAAVAVRTQLCVHLWHRIDTSTVSALLQKA